MPRIRWTMIFMCFLANVINFVDRANLAIAAPSIRAELGLDAVGMGLVLSAFFWTVRVPATAGRMVHRQSRRTREPGAGGGMVVGLHDCYRRGAWSRATGGVSV